MATRPAALLLTLACIACGAMSRPAPVIVQPGKPGETSRVITAAAATDVAGVAFTAADVQFMQGMIGHHAQALEMTALLPSRSLNEDMKRLALRIEVSQQDEIAFMRQWLSDRGQTLPDVHAHHAPGAVLMPGMLTSEEMARLEAAGGAEFDRLFLEFMIKHHQGALVMVEQLYSQAGAAQEPEIFAFSADVQTDQQLEIARMATMLSAR